MEKVCRLAVSLEKTAQIQIMAETIGAPKLHSVEEAKTLKSAEESEGGLQRFWAYYENRLKF